MAINNAGLNVMANAFAAAATYLSLHSGAAGAAGTSNTTTAARVASSWGAASNGDLAVSSARAFTGGAANGPVAEVGFWSAPTGGVFYGSLPLTGDATFNAAGEYNVTTLTLDGSAS